MKNDENDPKNSRTKPILATLIRLCVAVILLSVVYVTLDVRLVMRELWTAPWQLWAVIYPLYLLNTGLYVARLSCLVDGPLPKWRSYRAILIANFFGLGLPTGGSEAAKVVTLGRHVGGRDHALALIVASRLVEMAVWGALVGYAAVAVLPNAAPVLVPVAWFGVVALMGGAFVGLLGMADNPWWEKWVQSIPLLGPFVATTWRRYRRIRPTVGQMSWLVAYTVMFALINCTIAWSVFHAFGADIDFLTTLGLQPTMDIIISLPITMSGVGVREWVYASVLPGFGVSISAALAMGYARYSGHLFRALLGGVFYLLGKN